MSNFLFWTFCLDSTHGLHGLPGTSLEAWGRVKYWIMMDPLKLAGIRDWPVPTTVKQVHSFLGFGNFYCRFISGFAHIA